MLDINIDLLLQRQGWFERPAQGTPAALGKWRDWDPKTSSLSLGSALHHFQFVVGGLESHTFF